MKWEYQCKNTRSADFCADQIDVRTNFAVITNVVIKMVHCSQHIIMINIMVRKSNRIIVLGGHPGSQTVAIRTSLRSINMRRLHIQCTSSQPICFIAENTENTDWRWRCPSYKFYGVFTMVVTPDTRYITVCNDFSRMLLKLLCEPFVRL